jgi:2-iminobutanoate/2-iminopropanoate deaminase
MLHKVSGDAASGEMVSQERYSDMRKLWAARPGEGKVMSKEAVGGTQPGGAYSPGIIAEGRFLYGAGQTPTRDGVVTGATTGEQTAIALENVAAVLAEAGASMADVVRCGVYLANMADFAEMNDVYARAFPHPLPARTTVGVSLAGFKVEIDCVAVLSSRPSAAGATA